MNAFGIRYNANNTLIKALNGKKKKVSFLCTLSHTRAVCVSWIFMGVYVLLSFFRPFFFPNLKIAIRMDGIIHTHLSHMIPHHRRVDEISLGP